jgi:DNA-binding transcriptional LysR family regulator
MPMHHTRFLSYVDAVARSGSIRKAAERLHVASSAVNRRVQDLERELGTPIFERLPRGVRLTAAGEIFLSYIRRRDADLEHVRSEIEDLGGLRRGAVAIAASQAVAHGLLPREIVAFQGRYPGIAFKARICDRDEAVRAVTSFETDLALVFNPPRTHEFRALAEIEQRMCALVAPDHPLAGQRAVRIKDCARYPIALPDSSLSGRALLEEHFARASLRLEPRLESNSFEMMRNFARVCGGVCFQVQIGAERGVASDLVAVPIEERGLPRGRLVLGALRGRVLPIAAARFAEQLEARLVAMR